MMYSYRVLTPTMYRSRMASARQAVSMDYDDDSGAVKKARLRREGRVVKRFALGTFHILRKHIFGFYGPTHPQYKQIMLVFSFF